MNFKKKKLSNGLRVITVPMKGAPTAMVLVAVETGSNYEKKEENGLSHFLEHMVFKGTKRRKRSLDINKELDSLGAVTNAFTTEEFTGYYAKANKKHFTKLFDIISDMYLNPTLPKADIETERGVIIEEINMYEDLPQWKVYDLLNKLLYGNVPAGRTILGSKGNIKKFQRKDFLNYRKKHYVAKKTMVVVAGDVTEARVLKEVEKAFKGISRGKAVGKEKVESNQKKPKTLVEHKMTDQTHLKLAFKSFKAGDKRATAAEVLATVLGKGMSSRIWHRMREELGACYYVRASHNTFTDHGALVISTGINGARLEEVVEALLEECRKLKVDPVSKEELDKAKEYMVGHLYMGLETTDSLAEFYLIQEFTSNKLKTPEELEAEIRAITPEDIKEVAQDLFKNENLNLAVLGDVKETKRLKEILKI